MTLDRPVRARRADGRGGLPCLHRLSNPPADPAVKITGARGDWIADVDGSGSPCPRHLVDRQGRYRDPMVDVDRREALHGLRGEAAETTGWSCSATRAREPGARRLCRRLQLHGPGGRSGRPIEMRLTARSRLAQVAGPTMAFQETDYHPYDFANRRHIGPSPSEIAAMLRVVGAREPRRADRRDGAGGHPAGRAARLGPGALRAGGAAPAAADRARRTGC